MSIRYFTQIQQIAECEKHGDHATDWQDSCTGHDDYDKAVTCQELMKQSLAGKVTNSPLIPDEMMQTTNFLGGLLTALGVKFAFRLIKRTTTDEVLDA